MRVHPTMRSIGAAFVLFGLLCVAAPAHAQSSDQMLSDTTALIGLDAEFLINPAGEVSYLVQLDAGGNLLGMFNLGAGLSVGAADIATGCRWGLGIAPRLEASGFVLDNWLQLYGRARVLIQGRFGGDLDASHGIAPLAALGARAWINDCSQDAVTTRHGRDSVCIGFGLETRVHWAADGGLLFAPRVLPEGSILWGTGFSVVFAL